MPVARAERGGESPQELFEGQLERIEGVVSWVTRRFCMGPDDAEEFRSWVHLKLIEDDYRVLRSFSGRSGIATYLTAVIQNLARDYRTGRWGRWRPTAQAERLGLRAVQLETLLERDGFSLDEAVEMLRANHGARESRLELVELAAELPARVRLRFEGDDEIATASSESRADRGVREAESARVLDRARRVLARCLRALGVEDRLVLKMHYRSGLTISAIAAALDLDRRRLYTRRDRCRREIKKCVEGAGLDAPEVLEALGWVSEGFELDYGVENGELERTGPSNTLDGGDEVQR